MESCGTFFIHVGDHYNGIYRNGEVLYTKVPFPTLGGEKVNHHAT